jgi:hypothetical protein
VYKATGGRHPLDFFKTNSERFEKEVRLIKEKNPSYAAFFCSDVSTDETLEENPPKTQSSVIGLPTFFPYVGSSPLHFGERVRERERMLK